jgi:hypothetical protein
MEDQQPLLNLLNERANKIAAIIDHFNKMKVPIDVKYLDNVDDEQLQEIYKITET